MEVQRRLLVLNQRVKCLENENSVLRQRLSDIINGQVGAAVTSVKQYLYFFCNGKELLNLM